MALTQLEINKFSPEGEILRRIRCLAGRVTVFRSQNEVELEKFKKALEGKAQADRFSVLVDNVAFYPEKHTFIGFGVLDDAPSQGTVTEYLAANGLIIDAVEATLLVFGLGGLSRMSCTSLDPNQWKMLRLAALCVAKELPRVVIMNEPFENIPDQYRDAFAERMAKAAWEKNAIMVVTKVSYRPSVWIENDYISRVQLERPRQGTIGFGGGELGSAETIANIRKELGITQSSPASHKQPTAGVDLLAAPPKSITQKILLYLDSPKMLGLTVSLCVALCAIVFLLLHDSGQYPDIQTVQNSASSHTGPSNDHFSALGSNEQHPPANVVHAELNTRKVLLEGYPKDIQSAWSDAIEHPETLFKNAVQKTEGDINSPDTVNNENSPIKQLYQELKK